MSRELEKRQTDELQLQQTAAIREGFGMLATAIQAASATELEKAKLADAQHARVIQAHKELVPTLHAEMKWRLGARMLTIALALAAFLVLVILGHASEAEKVFTALLAAGAGVGGILFYQHQRRQPPPALPPEQ